MAVGDSKWYQGQLVQIRSYGTEPDTNYWYQGRPEPVHEYYSAPSGLDIPIAMYHYMHH